MVKIGEEITETLDYTPASLVIKRTIRPKYVDSKNERIHIGPLPERPLSKGIAEAGLLAHILVSKFVDHLPYYRQIQRFKRDFRWEVSQSTINNWMAACCTLLKPLYQDMKKKILQSHYIQADESPIRVLDQDKPKFSSTVRAELVSWTLHDADPELAAHASEDFERLGAWFEAHLAESGDDTSPRAVGRASWSTRTG